MKKILVPIDLSEHSDRPLAAAKLLADKAETELLLLHAYQPYAPDMPDMTVPGAAGMIPLSPEIEKSFKKRLNDQVTTLEGEGFRVQGLWSVGGIEPAVKEAIADHRPDLVVMGRSGEGGFLDSLIGSSATDIGLEANCPVLIVPPKASPTKFKEIVYATQLEYDENDILRRALPVFERMAGRVTFLKINSPAQPNVQSDDQYTDQIMGEFGVPRQAFVLRDSGAVLQGIEDYCDEIEADLLVMSTRKRGFIEALITNPSLTKKMILHTHIPLLVYHIEDSE
ncbi:universal stress protein [Persicitalea sp.]|uniref:universal stress protein n=1 Tax=Persicitalea sp. TaxID=3100273 RepID=UPI003593FDC5